MAQKTECQVCRAMVLVEHVRDMWEGSRYVTACPECVGKMQKADTPPPT